MSAVFGTMLLAGPLSVPWLPSAQPLWSQIARPLWSRTWRPLLDGGDPFAGATEEILRLAGHAWGFLAGLLIVVALLGGLFFALQGAAGASFGGGKMTSTAVLGIVGVVLLVLLAFLLLPELGKILKDYTPAPPF
jgi:hypothetical protein